MDSYYSQTELEKIGFYSIGQNVKLSRNACIYGAAKMVIGNNVRIDDFCVLSGKITIGNNVHIAVHVALFGGDKGISIGDYTGISSRTCVYSASDDYSGEYLSNPTVPDEFRKVDSRPVIIENHVLIGTTSVIMPGVTIKEGSSFGAFSYINRDSEAWSINVGIPFRKIGQRSKKMLSYVSQIQE